MLIALTGGIGSGKSTVAKRWVELGATEVDADLLAREVVEPGTKGLKLVVEAFGSEVLAKDGTLDRAELAKVAFSNEANRLRLEAILHPLIQELAAKRIANIDGVIVYTIPLLAETKSQLEFDKVATISCDEEVRIRRLVDLRGLTEADAEARVRAQVNDSDREKRADFVINSNCSLEELISRADKAFEELTSRN